MSEATGVSTTSVHRIWRAFVLRPHLQDTFKLSTNPHFVDKVRDVVGLYLNPPDRALVLCVDEKSQIQALNRTQPGLPLTFGKPASIRPTAYIFNASFALTNSVSNAKLGTAKCDESGWVQAHGLRGFGSASAAA